MSLALLFPGQGAQHAGMVADLPDSPAIASTLRESEPTLRGLGLSAILEWAAPMQDTVDIQIGLLVVEVACARALCDDYGLAPAFIAGHSVGAFAAAITAGVLTLAEALTAVRLRGELMQKACAGGDWGMAALTGLPVRAAQRLVDDTDSADEPLWVANINGATQTVVSGTAAALAAAAQAAQAAGARAFERLDVPVASHGRVQAGTADAMTRHLSTVPRRTPTARYVTNIGGRSVNSADAILDDLAKAVAHPVRWYDATRLMAELGVTRAVETPPGHVLTRLWTSSVPQVTCVAIADTGLAAAAAAARR
jgi:malonate decarboxylase epsilon subunit